MALDSRNIQFLFFLFLVVISFILLFFLFKPFLSALFFAVTLSVVFYPIHKIILRKINNRQTIAALLSTFLVLVLILLPLAFLSVSLFQEAANLYVHVTSENTLDNLNQYVFIANDYASNVFPGNFEISKYLEIRQYAEQGLSWILDNVSALFSGFVKGFVNIFLLILALFYFFRDGHKLRESFLKISPLSEEYDNKLLNKIGVALNSVARGRLLVGVLQGIVIALGFMIFSVPNPILWGTVAAVFSVLPALGPMLVVLPASAFLYFFAGSPLAAMGIIIWGGGSVLLIDEYLGSILVDRGMKIHPFLTLLSILGGLAFFGPIGFLLGPVSLALFFALLEIYPTFVKA